MAKKQPVRVAIDSAALVAWLEQMSVRENVVVHAVYQGLIDRIRRGDFSPPVDNAVDNSTPR